LLGECPARRRYRKRQPFLDGPAMISDAIRHRRCGPAPDVGETRMGRAKIVDRTSKIHAILQRQRVTRQRSTSACQRGQTPTERRVEPLDGCRIDDPVALRAPSERLAACWRAIDTAVFDRDYTSPLGALDDVSDQDIAPRTPPRPSALPRVRGLAQGLPHGPDGGHQAIRTDQQEPTGRTTPHALDQPPDQGQVTLLADLAAQPQVGLAHHGQRHPHHTARFLDTHLVGLHLAPRPVVVRPKTPVRPAPVAQSVPTKRRRGVRRIHKPPQWLARDSHGRARSRR